MDGSAATLRIGLLQGPDGAGSKEHMLDAMAHAAAEVAAKGARLLVMPELFLTGYNIGAAAIGAAAEPQDGPSAAVAGAIARAHDIALLYGYPERGGGGGLYNSALLVGADGTRLANYRKIHLFGDMEKAAFTPGNEPCVIVELEGVRVGVLICYDVEFPEAVRSLALRGADLVCVPTALMQPYDFVSRVLVRARAYESQLFVTYVNRTGLEGDLRYVGESCVVGPDGADLARAGAGPAILTAELDMAALAHSRRLLPYLADRAPLHYAALAEPSGRSA